MEADRPRVKRLLERMIEEQGGLCFLCERSIAFGEGGLETPTIEHVLPTSRGGTNDRENVRAAHKICNNIKRNRTMEEFWGEFPTVQQFHIVIDQKIRKYHRRAKAKAKAKTAETQDSNTRSPWQQVRRRKGRLYPNNPKWWMNKNSEGW